MWYLPHYLSEWCSNSAPKLFKDTLIPVYLVPTLKHMTSSKNCLPLFVLKMSKDLKDNY